MFRRVRRSAATAWVQRDIDTAAGRLQLDGNLMLHLIEFCRGVQVAGRDAMGWRGSPQEQARIRGVCSGARHAFRETRIDGTQPEPELQPEPEPELEAAPGLALRTAVIQVLSAVDDEEHAGLHLTLDSPVPRHLRGLVRSLPGRAHEGFASLAERPGTN